MKAYIRSFELILATILLLSIYIYAMNVFAKYKSLEQSGYHELSEQSYTTLDYLANKGFLASIAEEKSWDKLSEKLDKLLTSEGVGYKIIVYEIDSEGSILKIYEYTNAYTEYSTSKDSIYYYIPPTSSNLNRSYLLILYLSR